MERLEPSVDRQHKKSGSGQGAAFIEQAVRRIALFSRGKNNLALGVTDRYRPHSRLVAFQLGVQSAAAVGPGRERAGLGVLDVHLVLCLSLQTVAIDLNDCLILLFGDVGCLTGKAGGNMIVARL